MTPDGAPPIAGLLAGDVLLGLLSAFMVRQLLLARRSLRWPATEGRILRSVADSSNERTRARIEYAYTVDGRTFHSSRVAFLEVTGPATADVLARYREGAAVQVRYRPGDPSFAVLEPGPGPWNYILVALLVPMTLLLAGFTLVEAWKRSQG